MPIKVLNEFLPNAEETRLGAIKVGDTLEIDQEEGVLNVDPTSVIGLYYSNCITEIAQDVKLEIVGDNFVLKTGSRVYIPAGNNNTFSLYTTEEDITVTNNTGLNGQWFITLLLENETARVIPQVLNCKSGTTFPEDPTNTAKFYKSDENLMYVYDSDRGIWRPINLSIPLAIVNFVNGVAEDIIQVFNGASYFGHHTFILPGLKGVAPDGITERGYVKSVNIEVDDIKVYDLTFGSVTNFNNSFLFLNPLLEVACQSYNTVDRAKELVRVTDLIQYSYNENRDYAWTGTTYINPINLPIVECSLKDSTITYFRILQPLRIATVSDVKESTDSFLFDYKWADHIPNKLSWLRADTFSWQDGNIYKAAYEHLVNEYEAAGSEASASDTINGTTVWYRLCADGHKVCPSGQADNVQAIYNSASVAWYYIIDSSNHRFKLPRTKFGFTGIRDGVGRYVAPGLPNITGDVGPLDDASKNNGLHGTFYNKGAYAYDASSTGSGNGWILGFEASRSNSIYGASSTVQPPATQMYLYCYVGKADQDALEKSEIDIAAITNNSINQITSTKNTSLTEINITTEEGINRLNTDSNALNRTQITNCITEIPQDIKLELNDGTLKLKAGSKVYIPNGFEEDGTTPKFNSVIIENDVTFNTVWSTSVPCYLLYSPGGNNLVFPSFTDAVFTYDRDTNQIFYNSEVQDWTLPLGIVTRDPSGIGCINQVFNGLGCIDASTFALPGLKVMIPNGLNADGTYNNIEYTTPHVTIEKNPSANTSKHILLNISNTIRTGVNHLVGVSPRAITGYTSWYNPSTNLSFYHSTNETIWHPTLEVSLGRVYYNTNNKIAWFNCNTTLNTNVNNDNIDYVVEYLAPTASSYTWYRLYKSGWIEQGGMCNISQDTATTVTLQIPMANTNYFISITARKSSTQTGGDGNFTADPISTTQFYWRNGDDFSGNGYWEVKGFAAGY